MSMRTKEARKREVRGNIEFVDPNGTFLFYNNLKRADWYMKRNLAIKLSDSKYQLTFKPKAIGLSELNDPYLKQTIENKCVCCGNLENLNTHHVFPHCFTSGFNPKEKAIIRKYSTHDVLIVCVSCHHFYEDHAERIKNQICKDLREVLREDKSIWKASKLLCTYFKHVSKIPDNNKGEIENNIRDLLNDHTTPLIELHEKYKNTKYTYRDNRPYELFIKDYLNNPEKLDEYIISWRKHFIDVMQPRHLPPLWDYSRKIMVENWDKENIS